MKTFLKKMLNGGGRNMSFSKSPAMCKCCLSLKCVLQNKSTCIASSIPPQYCQRKRLVFQSRLSNVAMTDNSIPSMQLSG